MNRRVAQVFALILALGVHTMSLRDAQAENAKTDLLKISVTNVDGRPAVSIQYREFTGTAKSLTFVTGASKTQVTLTPIDGEIELRAANLVIRAAELRLSTTDLEIQAIDMEKMELPKSAR